MAARCTSAVIALILVTVTFSFLLYQDNITRWKQLGEILDHGKQMELQTKLHEIKCDSKINLGSIKVENETKHTLFPLERWALLLNVVTNVTYKCNNGQRMGHPLPLDGGWDVCLDVGIKPNACIVYSVGIADDWSFDDDMAEYGCSVYSFDPFNGYKEYQRSERNWFYDIGLCDTDDDHMVHRYGKEETRTIKCKTLSSIKKMLHHEQKTVDVLKMDIESDELKVLPQLLKSGILSDIKQLDLELHPWTKDILTVYEMFKTLQQDFGFELWSVNENKYSPLKDYGPYGGTHHRLLELAWVNANFLNKI